MIYHLTIIKMKREEDIPSDRELLPEHQTAECFSGKDEVRTKRD
jgi:hypothetical protein